MLLILFTLNEFDICSAAAAVAASVVHCECDRRIMFVSVCPSKWIIDLSLSHAHVHVTINNNIIISCHFM